jgi:hypothetical protein
LRSLLYGIVAALVACSPEPEMVTSPPLKPSTEFFYETAQDLAGHARRNRTGSYDEAIRELGRLACHSTPCTVVTPRDGRDPGDLALDLLSFKGKEINEIGRAVACGRCAELGRPCTWCGLRPCTAAQMTPREPRASALVCGYVIVGAFWFPWGNVPS